MFGFTDFLFRPSIFSAWPVLKSNVSLYSLYYAEACNELAGPIALLRPGNTAPFKEMLQRWQAIGNTVRFDRSEILTLDLPFHRQTRYRWTKWPVLACFQLPEIV